MKITSVEQMIQDRELNNKFSKVIDISTEDETITIASRFYRNHSQVKKRNAKTGKWEYKQKRTLSTWKPRTYKLYEDTTTGAIDYA